MISSSFCPCTAITIGFALPEYSVAEDSGIFQPEPVSIIKEADRVSEQVLTINLDFIDNTANSGIMHTIFRLLAVPECHS